MNGQLLPAIVESIRTRKDNTVAITLATQELSPGRAGELFGLLNKLVVCYLSEKETIPQKELDQVDQIDPELGGKTPSQRMRNTLYVLYTNAPEGYKTFDDFYKAKMESIIDHFKNKIP